MGEAKVSLYEDEIYGEEETPEPTLNLIIFSLSNEWYGLDMTDVDTIVYCSTLTLLPNVPEHIGGVFNLRGNIVSATDLKVIFGLSRDELKEQIKIVVISSEGLSTGLLIDGSERAIEIPSSKVEDPVATLEGARGYMIEGQFEWDGKLIAILNAKKIIEKTKCNG